MIVKEEEGVMSTFQFVTHMGFGGFPDLHDKLQGFFQKAREADIALTTKAEELEQEAVELEACARDLHVRAQERSSIVTQLDLEAADTFQQVHTSEEKIQAERAKHLGHLTSDLEASRLGLVGLL
ncbi:hypothetical protein LIER_06769 [Lithospermum erythrorhizon]|uniref:Uncharacterized protein n=1 Tax=Lithospermum erythrorhizon TaxID=34254 RepID=A0AAV3P5K9_LITER